MLKVCVQHCHNSNKYNQELSQYIVCLMCVCLRNISNTQFANVLASNTFDYLLEVLGSPAMSKRSGTWEEQEQKRLRMLDNEEEPDSLVQQLEQLLVEDSFLCAFCQTETLTTAQRADWNYWVTLAQDPTGVYQLQQFLGIYLKYKSSGQSVTRLGCHYLCCKACLQQYKCFFQTVADTAQQEKLPAHLTELRAADGATFQAYRIVAKLLASQMAPKLFALQ
jgi:hypothetical protein